MTDTEAKALALVNEWRERKGFLTTDISPTTDKEDWQQAAKLAIEREAATEARHAAELREQAERFSEALKRYYGINGCPPHPILAPFILPAPDPLVELVQEAFSAMLRANSPDGLTEALRAALAARGGKIVWEAGE